MDAKERQFEASDRDALTREIQAAFHSVVRGKGISWNECLARDNYESEAVCLVARDSDKDTHWSQLVDDPSWEPFTVLGGFSFIDAEGFRYYLPPTMMRLVQGDSTEGYPGHLLELIGRFTDQEHLALWSPEQLRCIALFIAFMATLESELDWKHPWVAALESRWRAYLR